MHNYSKRIQGVLSGYCLERLFSSDIPSSTVVVERGFSLLLNIITKKRNRLTEQNTDALMRICHRNKELCSENL